VSLSELHPDRLFPTETGALQIARRLHAQVDDLPIVSPHGHTDPRWFAQNEPFSNPTELLLTPDHYVLRMLFSQGVDMARMGIPPLDGGEFEQDPRVIWRLFAGHYHLFRGTPSRLWMDYVFQKVFGVSERLTAETADTIYDALQSCLGTDPFRPRALFEEFNIEVLATTESPLDELAHHRTIAGSGWNGRVITTFRPDNVVDPEFEGFADNVQALAGLTRQSCATYSGYLNALRDRRGYFKSMGATATDHGHPTAATADLSGAACEALFQKAMLNQCTGSEAEQFRGQLLTEMAAMSLEDGLVMQLHPGSWRNHNPSLFARFGRDKGADIPMATGYVAELKPLLDRFGNEKNLTLILFTLDETTYSRELAPLAGHYPILTLGPPWWFHDSPNGMQRFREMTAETAGFYNTAGFNDDTRAFLSIPARHDVARRMDCSYLARLVAERRLAEDEAADLAVDLAYRLVKKAYRV
jgi:glucuronate isomerase